jgi:hypothetical protein
MVMHRHAAAGSDPARPATPPPGGRRALLVVNTRSRGGQEASDAAGRILEEAGFQLRREDCLDADALQATIRRLAGEVDLVVLGGGDGTMNSAAPALMETGLPLGVLPLGTRTTWRGRSASRSTSRARRASSPRGMCGASTSARSMADPSSTSASIGSASR